MMDGSFLTGSAHNIWALLRARNIPLARDGAGAGDGLLRWQQRQLEHRAQLQEAAESVDWPWKPRDLELLQQRFHLLEGTGPGRPGGSTLTEEGEEGSVLTYEGFLKFWKHLRRLLPEVSGWGWELQVQLAGDGWSKCWGVAVGVQQPRGAHPQCDTELQLCLHCTILQQQGPVAMLPLPQ
jgi:hypothetical protein